MSVKIATADGTEIEMPTDLAEKCDVIKNLIENEGEDEAIPAEFVTKEMFAIVVEFLTYCKANAEPEIDQPITSDDLEDAVTDKWFAEFMKDKDSETIYGMANAGVKLGCQPLVNLATAKIVTTIKGKSIEDIRKIFGVESDFSAEEEAAVEAENKMAENFF